MPQTNSTKLPPQVGAHRGGNLGQSQTLSANQSCGLKRREDEHEGAWMGGLHQHLDGWLDPCSIIPTLCYSKKIVVTRNLPCDFRAVHVNLKERFDIKKESFENNGSTRPTRF